MTKKKNIFDDIISTFVRIWVF